MDRDMLTSELSSEFMLPITSGSVFSAVPSLAFSPDQVTCICEALLQSGNIERLTAFLRMLPQDQLLRGHESLLRARATVAFHSENYYELYNLLKYNIFQMRHHLELQQLWYRAHYRQFEKVQDRPATAKEKHYVRNKYPPPATIWDGIKTYYNYTSHSLNVMKETLDRNRYPTTKEKGNIARKTGLSLSQVKHWFKNQRQRDPNNRQPPGRRRDAHQSHQLTPLEPLSLRSLAHPYVASVVATSVATDQLAYQPAAVAEPSIWGNTQVKTSHSQPSVASEATDQLAYQYAAVAEPSMWDNTRVNSSHCQPYVVSEATDLLAFQYAAVAEPSMWDNTRVKSSHCQPYVTSEATELLAYQQAAVAEPSMWDNTRVNSSHSQPSVASEATDQLAYQQAAVAEPSMWDNTQVKTSHSRPSVASEATDLLETYLAAVAEPSMWDNTRVKTSHFQPYVASEATDLLETYLAAGYEASHYDNTRVMSEPSDMHLDLLPPYSAHYNNAYESPLLHNVMSSPQVTSKVVHSKCGNNLVYFSL